MLRHRKSKIFDAYRQFMQNIVNRSALTLDIDPAHQNAGVDLAFIQNFKSNGSAFSAFMPHMVVLVLLFLAQLYFS